MTKPEDLAHMDDQELADEVEHARECFARTREAMLALREEQAGYMARIRAGAAEQARRENRALEILAGNGSATTND